MVGLGEGDVEVGRGEEQRSGWDRRLAKEPRKLNGEPQGLGIREPKVPGGNVGFRREEALGSEMHGTFRRGFCPGCSLVGGGGGGLRPACGTDSGPRRADECLTLHMQEDGGLRMAGRAGGVADVLARVLLGYPGDDQCVTFQLVLPGQWGAQLGPVDGGLGAACEAERKVAEVTGLPQGPAGSRDGEEKTWVVLPLHGRH